MLVLRFRTVDESIAGERAQMLTLANYAIYYGCRRNRPTGANKREQTMKVHTVKSNGKTIRTMDNPLNTWVRSIDDGQFYRVDR